MERVIKQYDSQGVMIGFCIVGSDTWEGAMMQASKIFPNRQGTMLEGWSIDSEAERRACAEYPRDTLIGSFEEG